MEFKINIHESLQNSQLDFGVYKGDVIVPDKYICTKNTKRFSRFFYVLQGTIYFDRNTDHFIAAPAGTIVYLPYDVTYISEWDNHENGRYISINFNLQGFNLELPSEICIATFDKTGYYLDLFSSAYDIWERGAVGYKIELLSFIYKLLYHLFSDTTYQSFKKSNQIIYKGIFYLENHYTEDISVDYLAQLCNLSTSSFRRHFKKYKNMSPITYRNYLRIQKAKELLRTGEYSVTEAAYAVNIYDLCYFNKLFHKYNHLSPSNFLKQL